MKPGAPARQERGGLKETVGLEAEGEDVEIAFNAVYLLEALRAAGDSPVEVLLNGKIGPALIRATNCPGYLGLVLPLRLL
ncbi:MAG: hypothetical protein C4570_07180 [Ammonifex sp.]|nr:MAG: hypothetical protein C4570_07180 [Ammonifex sp.]